MEEKKVSIMMPVYNGMPKIKASIESLLNQSYNNWECIIVNDGSTDGTRQYLDSLLDKRFRVIHFEENRGRPIARQVALDNAMGEYLAMLDADDLIHPDKLKLQVEAFENNPEIDLVASGICSFGDNVDFIRIRCRGDNLIKEFFIGQSFPVAHACSMLRTKKAQHFKYNTYLSLGQDIDFLRRYLDGCKYMSLDKVLYYYSEFDSVTKKKIRKAYKLYCVKFFYAREYLNSFLSLLKYIYSVLFFPFINIESLLKRRGVKPSSEELKDYNKYCKYIYNKY